MKKNTLIFLLSLLSWALCAQEGNNGNVGIGTTTPDNSAMLDVSSETKGLLVPHVKLTAINDSTSPIYRPANGLLVYHTGENSSIEMGFYYWNGHEWVGLCSCPAARFGVEILPSTTQICKSDTITLQANVTPRNGNYNYAWSNGETTASINVSPSVSTIYTVTVTDENGRSSTNRTTVNVRNLLTQQTFTVGDVSFNMMPVDTGTFLMGSQKTYSNDPNFDADAYDNEAPVHEVTLTKAYAIGETEVTQALWLAVMNSNPSNYAGDDRANHPVELVKWDDIMAADTGFLVKLNNLLKDSLCGMTFVLPTEAQWEYAAAGGKRGYNPTNHSRIHKYSGRDNIDDVAWYYENTYDSSPISYGTQPVKGKAANQLGLYDMSGNVWEWCSDLFGTYPSSPQSDPIGANSGSNRVMRGGSWANYANYGLPVACRADYSPDSNSHTLGFRLALVQNPSSN